VNRVVLELARCHAAFELDEPQLREPSHLGIKPLPLMTDVERAAFERDDEEFDVWPEVGGRAMQRVLVAGAMLSTGDGGSYKRGTTAFAPAKPWKSCFGNISPVKSSETELQDGVRRGG
jgi:hypothetical protein